MPHYYKFFILFFFIITTTKAQVLSPTFYEQLALRWAPIHIQNICPNGKDGLKGRADFVTAANFDGDWKMDNNWANLSDTSADLSAYAYYSIVQTQTHWYINYGFFHPRDWSNKPIIKAFDTHENDLEGELTIIKRPTIYSDTAFGDFLGMITVYHSGFYAFSNILKSNNVPVKNLEFWAINEQLHPVTSQQSRGHGLKAHPHIYEHKKNQIHYYPSLDSADVPKHLNDRHVSYKLINIFEKEGMWNRRNDIETFISPTGGFSGIYGGKYKAKPPWVWNSALDDASLKGGEHATDPVKLAKWYFDMGEDCSVEYEWKIY